MSPWRTPEIDLTEKTVGAPDDAMPAVAMAGIGPGTPRFEREIYCWKVRIGFQILDEIAVIG
tara:strand:+ start:390 stop:575 length:186 start_codon:yes stop_codon:yes gene_type:complete